MARIHILGLLLVAFITLVSAASAPTFCKCTCFKNSTIVPLGPESESPQSDPQSALRRTPLSSLPDIKVRTPFAQHPDDAARSSSRSVSSSCSECTKAFCLSQGIDFCNNAEEDDVVTMCFQRDSNKDKIIVWAFIVGTVGLLGWAAFKRVKEWQASRGFPQGPASYAPVSGSR